MAEHQDLQFIPQSASATFNDNPVSVKDEEGHVIGSIFLGILFPTVSPSQLPNNQTTEHVKGSADKGALEYRLTDGVGTVVSKQIVCTQGAVFDRWKNLTATVNSDSKVTIKEDESSIEAIFELKRVDRRGGGV